MSIIIKELFEYDLVKKCLKCGNISLKSNFHKNKNMRDGLYTHCKNCVIQKQKQDDIENRDKKREYYQNNRDRIKDYYLQNRYRIKEYQLKNHDKIIAQKRIYSNKKYKSHINFQSIRKTRSRIYKTLKGMTK